MYTNLHISVLDLIRWNDIAGERIPGSCIALCRSAVPANGIAAAAPSN